MLLDMLVIDFKGGCQQFFTVAVLANISLRARTRYIKSARLIVCNLNHYNAITLYILNF